jgi:4-aminobutyrate aminotransferase-like enzyme
VAKTKEILRLLGGYESRNIVFTKPDGSWPIVWERAKGVFVRDADGKRYLDLTAAFGVASAGHANPNVVKAGQKQMARLLHAMGDVHPHARKAELAKKLSEITFGRWTRFGRRGTPPSGKVIFCNSGFEAVEAALKTALLATGKPGVIAFAGGYHGLGYGALNVTHRNFFRGPFQSQLGRFGHFIPFPTNSEGRVPRVQKNKNSCRLSLQNLELSIRRIFRSNRIGAILVEPIQVRSGVNIPPLEFLPLLRKLCDEFGALLILDEIYTGFGRTGKWFACEHSGVVSDLICLGKALTGGFPLAACVGIANVMDAWPPSRGEAIHTSTFLGHPVGCAMALAQIKEIERLKLCERSAELGEFLLANLAAVHSPRFTVQARGLGLLAGMELQGHDGSPATKETFIIIKKMLARGFILLPEGEHGNVISFTPPLTITRTQLVKTVNELQKLLTTD